MSSHEPSAEEHGGFSYHQHPSYNGASSSNSPILHPLVNGSGAGHGGAHPHTSYQHHHQQQQHHAEVPTVALGRTRCYWCILSPSLDFVFVDPILHTHLEEQSKSFIGSNLLDYVHPDERQSLREDLMPKVGDAGGIEGSGVFGSITRCRYSRLPRIRKILGCQSPPEDPDARLVVEDDEYLQIRITTSWIGGGEAGTPGAGNLNGAVLAFFHATEDKDEARDNDESKRSSWSNWCGPRLEDGSYLDAYRCAQLADALQRATNSHLSTASPGGPPPHVFQILDHTGRAIVSFPNSGYDEEEYAALAREVLRKPRHEDEDTTSCTRRYRSKHPVMKDSALITVESVVVKYGAITFACFETGGIYFNSTQQKPADKFRLEDVPATFDSSTGSKRLSDSFADDSYSAKRARTQGEDEKPLSIATNPRLYAPKLSDSDRTNGGGISPTVASASAILGSFSHQQDTYQHHQPPFHPLQHTSHPQHHPGVYSNMYPPHPMQHQPPQHHAPPSFAYPPHPLAPQNHQPPPHPLSQQHSFAPPPPYGASAHLEHLAHATATSSTSPVESQLPRLPELLPPTSAPPPPQAPYGSAASASPKEPKSGKVKGEPKSKPGPKACESCGTANSPEWRKGPDGTKSLCNACGLRFARAVARKAKLAEIEANGGVAPPKKPKKGKAATNAAARQATVASSAPPSEPISSTATEQHHHQPPHHQRPSPPLPQHHHHPQIYELPPTSSAPQQPPPRPYSPYFTTAPPTQGHYSPVPSPNPSSYHHLPQINTNPGRYEGQRSASGGSHHNSPFGSPHPHSHDFQQQQHNGGGGGGEEELPRRSSAGGQAGFVPPPSTSLGGSHGHLGWAPAPLPPSSQPGGYQPYSGWGQHERNDGGGGYGN